MKNDDTQLESGLLEFLLTAKAKKTPRGIITSWLSIFTNNRAEKATTERAIIRAVCSTVDSRMNELLPYAAVCK